MKWKWLGPFIAAVGGAVWCCSYAWPLVDPWTLDVVLQDDWAQHTLGWLFFRREPIAFPLGRIHDYLYPYGTTLGYMDSIPLLALALRPFSSLLPQEFQYLGLWLVFCSALLAWAGARVAALSTRCWEQQALAGVLVAMAPTLLQRIVHPALCAHFFLVLAILQNLTPSHSPGAAKRTLWGALALLFISAATHPYLACMVCAILLGVPYRLRHQLGPLRASAAVSGMLALLGAALVLFGYIGMDMRVGTGGFGRFSANLSTFVNSLGHSRIFPELRGPYLQYEGYSYLGAGCLFLCAGALCLLTHPRLRARIASFPWQRAAWPLMAATALAIFAFATPWMWGDSQLLQLDFYKHIVWLTEVFRSSGRMIWPLAYLIVLAATTVLLRALRSQRWAASGVLLAALGLQLYDIDLAQTSWVRVRMHAGNRNIQARYSAQAWSLTDPGIKHLVLYPAEIQEVCESEGGYRADQVNALAYLAYRRGWTFNSGYAARLHRDAADSCMQLDQQVRAGALREDTIYVVRQNTKLFRRAGATCGQLDGASVCVLQAGGPLATFLAQHKR